MADEKKPTILRPGFASEEPAEEEPKLESPSGEAHYSGLTEAQATETWQKETLCNRCLCAGVCRVAAGAQGPLAVVSRCLSFLPVTG